MSPRNISLTSQQSKFRWLNFRFSIRTLLIVVPLLALVVAGVKRHVDSQIAAVERERQAIAAIEATGAVIGYATFERPILSQTPAWLRRYFTDETYWPVSNVFFFKPRNVNLKQPLDEVLAQLQVHLEALTHPVKISLSNTNVTDRGLQYLAGMKRLRQIALDRTEVTNAGLAHLESLNELELLDLDGTRVNGAGLIHLQNFKKLQVLDLNNCPITDQDLIHLRGLANLQHLELSNTKLTDQGMVMLAELKELRVLRLGLTAITNEAIKQISKSPKLETLFLAKQTNIDNAAIKDLITMPKLRLLDITETLIDADGFALLSSKMPNCKIEWRARSE